MAQSLPHYTTASCHAKQQKGEDKKTLVDDSCGWFGLRGRVDVDVFCPACYGFLEITDVITGNGLLLHDCVFFYVIPYTPHIAYTIHCLHRKIDAL